MMRRMAPVLFVLLTMSATAWAGSTVFAGLSIPTGSLNDSMDVGYNAGVSMMMPVAPMVFAVGGTAMYDHFPGSQSGEHYNLFEMIATAKLTLAAGPQLIGGVGYAITGVSIDKSANPDLHTDNQSEIVLGAGTKLMLLEFTGLWHHLADVDFVTLSAGLGF